jgi:hypothetical protein
MDPRIRIRNHTKMSWIRKTRGKTSRNHLNEEIAPVLPAGIDERFSQTKSNLGYAVQCSEVSPKRRKIETSIILNILVLNSSCGPPLENSEATVWSRIQPAKPMKESSFVIVK